MLFLDVVLISLNVYRGVMYHFLYKISNYEFIHGKHFPDQAPMSWNRDYALPAPCFNQDALD